MFTLYSERAKSVSIFFGTEMFPLCFREPWTDRLGSLKLPKKDALKFLAALQAYGQERTPAFLRRCAYALIAHHKNKEPLITPLAFQLGYRQTELQEPGAPSDSIQRQV
jgi:hypothetical protein